jgi:hypothetical protein
MKDENQYSSCSKPLTSLYMVKTTNAKKSKEGYIIAYEKLLK